MSEHIRTFIIRKVTNNDRISLREEIMASNDALFLLLRKKPLSSYDECLINRLIKFLTQMYKLRYKDVFNFQEMSYVRDSLLDLIGFYRFKENITYDAAFLLGGQLNATIYKYGQKESINTLQINTFTDICTWLVEILDYLNKSLAFDSNIDLIFQYYAYCQNLYDPHTNPEKAVTITTE